MSLRAALKASLQDNPGPDEGPKHVSTTANKRKTKEGNKKNIVRTSVNKVVDDALETSQDKSSGNNSESNGGSGNSIFPTASLAVFQGTSKVADEDRACDSTGSTKAGHTITDIDNSSVSSRTHHSQRRQPTARFMGRIQSAVSTTAQRTRRFT